MPMKEKALITIKYTIPILIKHAYSHLHVKFKLD